MVTVACGVVADLELDDGPGWEHPDSRLTWLESLREGKV